MHHFTLAPDLRQLRWKTPNKRRSLSVVNLSEVTGVVLGQRTSVFDRFKTSGKYTDREHLSFSLLYRSAEGQRSLDVVCADLPQYRVWLPTLQGIIEANRERAAKEKAERETKDRDKTQK